MGRWILTATLVMALGGIARGDRLPETPEPPKVKPLKKRVEENVDQLADEFGLHLSRLSFDILDMRFDVKERRAKVNLDAGDEEHVGLKLDSDVKFHGRFARVNAKLNLSLGGRMFELEIPEFDVGHSKVEGEHGVEVRLPLLHGKF